MNFDLFADYAPPAAPDSPASAAPPTESAASAAQPHPALSDTAALLQLCERWVSRGWLRDLDLALVRFFERESQHAPPLLLLGAALASHQLGRGHVCLDLAATLEAPDFALSLPPEGDDLNDPPPLPSHVLATLTLSEWQAALNHPTLISDGPGNTPLVVSHSGNTSKLYLRRYWQFEQTLHQEIANRVNADSSLNSSADSPLLKSALDTLFPASDSLDWQKNACALAARSPFAIITGGPGTGKTTTVVRLLTLLQTLQLAQPNAHPLRIRLAAPTGKAAARLNESIAGQVNDLTISELASLLAEHSAASSSSAIDIPTEVTTLHRLLGARADTRHFRHNAANPLALDVLVVDEASMVDIEMMTALLSALPASAKLVLLGDKDQLASVEAGAVLGDLCRRADAAHYTPATAQWLAELTDHPLPEALIDPNGQPLDQAITMLRVSHRFNAHSGIGQLAQAINQPLSDELSEREKHQAVHGVLNNGYADLHHLVLKPDAQNEDSALERLVITGSPERFPNAGEGRINHKGEPIAPPTGYRYYLNTLARERPDTALAFEENSEVYDAWAKQVLNAYSRFQLLCALRKGPWGVEGLNLRIAKTLRSENLLFGNDHTLEKGWFEGRPVLVTQNDYGLKLMNGDIGITMAVPDPRTPGRSLLRVAFPTSDAENPIHWVLPSRLHAVETVFAMTVHKSQGSEFQHTALLLPQTPNPILTRELVYTGITRARDWLTVLEAKRGILNDAVTREVMRVSG
ncbi:MULTISPECIES: exodeoxyribonuclease V subunit alpha [unclassified Halomonas]|uniref:exodeoxyribonuclease V subunit alpha n=1 Tax=unclassified Halomonas TaxID=2609666 RepID=UPI0007DA0748|nr:MULTISPECIES: exodeoxyribonuclease V subunit alpha [unclassified Halomonas]MBT2785491.1 exodeoxyribonuclease V subunit alpha [Halomonas sp. ISL-106]MBT2797825.1 exodeoxyribonuclease V subunit alpha [Halomonas sp. ISL-104]OAL59474.1 exodeoxyribonuclease V subunit alpha [Halomonas sp. ALS9]